MDEPEMSLSRPTPMPALPVFEAGAATITGPRDLGDLLDRAFRLVRRYFWTLALIGSVFLVPQAVIGGLLAAAGAKAEGGAAEAESWPSETDLFWLINLPLYTVVITVATLALTHHCLAALHGRALTPWACIRLGLRRFWPYCGLVLTQLCALALALAVAVVAGILAGVVMALGSVVAFSARSASDVAMVLAVVSVSIIVGIFLVLFVYGAARWLVAGPILVAERLGPIQALRRSWRLTQTNVRRSLGYLLLLTTLSILLTSLPMLLLPELITAVFGPAAARPAKGLGTAVGHIAEILSLPLSTAATVLFYYDLRVRREGYDLMLRVAQMETEADGSERAEPRGEAGA